MEMTTV